MRITNSLLFLLCVASLAGAERAPLEARCEDSAAARWLQKKVLESRVLDNMETLVNWSAFSTSPPGVVDARVQFRVSETNSAATISLTSERFRDGKHSLRLRGPTRLPQPGPKSGRGWGDSGILRNFGGEDWRGFNRISIWIYPDWPGGYVTSLDMQLRNDGMEKLPAAFGQEGQHTVVLRNHEWNHVVWEIGNVARDKVTGLQISYLMLGNEPEAGDSVTYDFDRLELEKVTPDYIEGWGVWPGRISYSHAGYSNGAVKTAIANGLGAREFQLLDSKTNQVVVSKPLQTATTHIGRFQVMDFSEVRETGSYRLRAGAVTTPPFRVGPDVWRESIRKALNFFYTERCGIAIPGVHGACHRDWQCVHGGRRIIINGGWHDAGDLTQGLGNTAEATYAMFELAERLHARGDDPELYERLIEEGSWGLDWILKTSFGDGFRNAGSVSSRRTNGILGDSDDIVVEAKNAPMENFLAAGVEALASRVLKARDPRLAAYCLKMAEADWRFGLAGLSETAGRPEEPWRGSFDSGDVVHEPVSVAVQAAVNLWRATGDRQYADKAAELARVILDSQQRRRPKWDVPLTGFFYTSPAKDRILHYCHRGREQAPIDALGALCDALPDHPDWMKWYSAIALHSQYLKTISRYTEPYGVTPASVYRDDEYLGVPESRRKSFRRQVLNGIPLGAGHFLRLFPVWLDYRGHFGTVLGQAEALSAAAHLRGDLDAARLSEAQLEWVIGRNPFAESTMWGEGHDFTPLYSPTSGDLVGALPVGIQTRGDSDVPYWPVQSVWTYKEVWVHPVALWISAMKNLSGPAVVEGQTASAVEFRDIASGHTVTASGTFRLALPEGAYNVRCGGEETRRVFLPGGVYHLDLRPGRVVAIDVKQRTAPSGEVTISLTARGAGKHRFQIRADNLTLETGPEREIALPANLTWHAKITSNGSPWFAVVVPDGDVLQKRELSGGI